MTSTERRGQGESARTGWIPGVRPFILPVATVFLLSDLQQVEAATDLTVAIHQTTSNPVVTGAKLVNYRVSVDNLGDTPTPPAVVVVTFPGTFGLERQDTSTTTYACADPITVGGEVSVSCTTPQVGAGAHDHFQVEARTPSAIIGQRQDFTIRAVADPDNAVAELNDANNGGSAVTTVDTRADLVPSAAGSPTSATVSSQVTYVMAVKNIGDRPTSAAVRAALPQEVDFKRLEHQSFTGCLPSNPPPGSGFTGKLVTCRKAWLMPGGEAGVDIVVRVPNGVPAGTRLEYTVTADPFDSITERKEANNTASVSTTIGAPQFDLDILPSTVEKVDAPTVVGFLIEVNTQVKLKLVIRNGGVGPSLPTTVRVAWPGDFCEEACFCPLGAVYDLGAQGCVFLSPPTNPPCTFNGFQRTSTCQVPAIDADHSVTIPVTAYRQKPFFQESVQVTAKVDPNNQVAETNESNNNFSLAFAVP